MRQQEIERKMQAENLRLAGELAKRQEQIEKLHLQKIEAIDGELAAKISELQQERDRLTHEVMVSKIAVFRAKEISPEQEAEANVQLERDKAKQIIEGGAIGRKISEAKMIAAHARKAANIERACLLRAAKAQHDKERSVIFAELWAKLEIENGEE